MKIETGERPESYCLYEAFANGQIFPIDECQHTTLDNAITTVVSAMELEELFQVFAQSFIRFEKDLLDLSLEYTHTTLRDSVEHEKFFSNVRQRFNVNIITVLTAFQSYVDHSDRILKYTKDLPTAREFNRKAGHGVYDAHLSYRVCYHLRNYAQHRALPLGGFSIGADSDLAHDDAGKVIKVSDGYSVSPWLDVPKFKSSKKINPSLREELDRLDEKKIDIKWLVRSFAGAMYERHATLREFLEPAVNAAGSKIAAGYELASAAKHSEAIFLELHGGGKKRPMRNDLATNVLREFATYRSLNNADRKYVTSKIKPDAGSYSGNA